jgi:hypothetical protein
MSARRATDIGLEELFSYVSLPQAQTGLPMVIWVPDVTANDPSLRVQTGHEQEASPNDVVLVAVSDGPAIVAGEGLSDADWVQVKKFVQVNRKLLLSHLRGESDFFDLTNLLTRI